jgi:hypothetical protein
VHEKRLLEQITKKWYSWRKTYDENKNVSFWKKIPGKILYSHWGSLLKWSEGITCCLIGS